MSFLSPIIRRSALRSTPASTTFRPTVSQRSFAKLTVIGRLAAEPELSTTSTGQEIIRYAVASNSGRKDNRTTSWFKVTEFASEGPRKDFMLSTPKGSLVYVEGEASFASYEGRDGPTKSLNIVQRHFEVLSRNDAAANSEFDESATAAAAGPA
ncbi:MAG: ssDNA-binding protein, mitochondrial [Chaenotheca gracillima]|nr:MAG: ssDNA-binding protein, mitochondrial [Chaenotheca gracillima]